MKIPRIPFIIIVISGISAGIILFYGGKSMDAVQWVAIAVAIIGVAGGIWTQIVQFKADNKRLKDTYERNVRFLNLKSHT